MSEVKKEANDSKKEVHFGDLMELCFLKHAELDVALQKYKGRCVFRGDNVKDQDGTYAVFSEQGTSASHIAAAKFIDAVARFPGNSGEDADATGAYTQVSLESMTDVFPVPTWIRLPKYRQPKWWRDKFDNPVVPLKVALYGHPLAGLLWEKHCVRQLRKLGWKPVEGWECLYKHEEMQLFLSDLCG